MQATYGKTRYAAALLFVRVLSGLLFWQHGLEKLFGFAGARPEPTLWAIRGVGGVIEAIGGPLLALGLFTRAAALPVFLFLLVSNVERWRVGGYFWNTLGLEYTLMWTVGALFFLVHGGGAISLDHLIGWAF